MKTNSRSSELLTLTALALVFAASPPACAHDHEHSGRQPAKPAVTSPLAEASAVHQLPPLPPDVTEVRFGDFFVRPVGATGLELTETLRQLDGRRVRILGYMVNQEEAPAGRFLFSPLPGQQVHEHDNGLADDLPASTVFVSVPTLPDKAVPFVPGLMLLTGTLSVGNRAEPDGRISLVRLALDPPSKFGRSAFSRRSFSAPVGKGAERLAARADRQVDSRR